MHPKPPTIKDIAARLGVSISTVSRALSGHYSISQATRDNVRQTAADLGYVANLPARQMRKRGGLVVGLLVPDLRNEFYSTLASVLVEHSRELSFQVVVGSSGDDPVTEEAQVRKLLGIQVSGIVISPTARPTEDTATMLRAVPTVEVLRTTGLFGGQQVCMEEAAGVRSAAAYLLGLGHERIAYVGTTTDLSSGRERVRGFRGAHAAMGVACREEDILLRPPTERAGFEMTREMLSRSCRPSALILGSTTMTVGALRAVRESGLRVPGQLSVIGYGDSPWAGLISPALTTIALPVEAMARTAARAIFQRIDPDEGSPFETEPLETRLMVRESTASEAL